MTHAPIHRLRRDDPTLISTSWSPPIFTSVCSLLHFSTITFVDDFEAELPSDSFVSEHTRTDFLDKLAAIEVVTSATR